MSAKKNGLDDFLKKVIVARDKTKDKLEILAIESGGKYSRTSADLNDLTLGKFIDNYHSELDDWIELQTKPRVCGQFILTKEEWKQKERKRRNGRLFYQNASPTYDFPLVAERIVPPRYVFYIALCLSPTVFCTSSCKGYKDCHLFFLSSAETYESNKLYQP